MPPGTSAADALRPSISSPGGNPLLGPETGSTWSIGGDFHPTTELGVDLTGLDLSITAFHIKFEHQIGVIVNNPTTLFSGAFNQYYILNPTLAQIQARYPRISATERLAATGFPGPDLASAFNTPGVNPPYIFYDLRRNNLGEALDRGSGFRGELHHGYRRFRQSVWRGFGRPSTPPMTNASSPDTGPPQYRAVQCSAFRLIRIRAATVGPVTGRVSVQYSPGFNLAPRSESVSLYHADAHAIFHPVNLFVSYDMSGLAPWLSDTEASITMNNIADEDPPIRLDGGTSTPGNGGHWYRGGRRNAGPVHRVQPCASSSDRLLTPHAGAARGSASAGFRFALS